MQLKTILKNLTRRFSAWAWAEEIAVADGVVQIEDFYSKPGFLEVEVATKPGIKEYIAQCFAELVAGSPNYTELKFEVANPKKDKHEWVTVLVQKGSGKTPHQLRNEAEQKLAAANVRIEKLSSELKAIDSEQCIINAGA